MHMGSPSMLSMLVHCIHCSIIVSTGSPSMLSTLVHCIQCSIIVSTDSPSMFSTLVYCMQCSIIVSTDSPSMFSTLVYCMQCSIIVDLVASTKGQGDEMLAMQFGLISDVLSDLDPQVTLKGRPNALL